MTRKELLQARQIRERSDHTNTINNPGFSSVCLQILLIPAQHKEREYSIPVFYKATADPAGIASGTDIMNLYCRKPYTDQCSNDCYSVCLTYFTGASRSGNTVPGIGSAPFLRDAEYTISCIDDGVGILMEKKERIREHVYGDNTGIISFLAREILSTDLPVPLCGREGKGALFTIREPAGTAAGGV